MDAKKIAAEQAVEQIENGMIIGLGTGSTAYWAIQKIAERVKQGLDIKTVATSTQSEALARELDIPVASFSEIRTIDLTIDGADEVDRHRNLIKGGGGALLREKIIAFNSKKLLVVVDGTKLVERLGRFSLPVEVIPFAVELTLKQISLLGCSPVKRMKNELEFITDNGNLILDCPFYPIEDPAALNTQLHRIPGVVETGLFLQEMVSSVYAGFENGTVEVF